MASCLVFLAAATTYAQYPYTGSPAAAPYYTRPVVSPYLNLFRAGAPPAVNYFNLVQPQIAFGSAIQDLQQRVTTLGQQTTGLETEAATGLPTTGRAVGFMTHYRYFQTFAAQNPANRGLGLATRPGLTSYQTQTQTQTQIPQGTPAPIRR
jgi:hypothetical protein